MFILVLKIVFIYCRVLLSFILSSLLHLFICLYTLLSTIEEVQQYIEIPSNNLCGVSVSCIPMGPVLEPLLVRKRGKLMTSSLLYVFLLTSSLKALNNSYHFVSAPDCDINNDGNLSSLIIVNPPFLFFQISWRISYFSKCIVAFIQADELFPF